VRALLEPLVRGAPHPLAARNLVREALQARLLASLQRAGAMVPLAFQGGTALRFLFGLRRYSEDLDFALERPGKGYDFRGLLAQARGDFAREGLAVDVRLNDAKVVHAAFLNVHGLLADLGLSGHRDEALSIKIEVDTRPPTGATLATTIVRRHELLHLHHHDRASLFAGKLHAVLQRPSAKGRDYFDLAWYLSDPAWPAPNLALLNNALAQSGARPLAATTWRRAVRAKLASTDTRRLLGDVRPFLESDEQAEMVDPKILGRLLRDPGR
jgi:hypothetical protein